MIFPLASFAELFIYIALLLSTIYSVIFGYHWYNYGSSSKSATISLIVFVSVAGLLIFLMYVSSLML